MLRVDIGYLEVQLWFICVAVRLTLASHMQLPQAANVMPGEFSYAIFTKGCMRVAYGTYVHSEGLMQKIEKDHIFRQ